MIRVEERSPTKYLVILNKDLHGLSERKEIARHVREVERNKLAQYTDLRVEMKAKLYPKEMIRSLKKIIKSNEHHHKLLLKQSLTS